MGNTFHSPQYSDYDDDDDEQPADLDLPRERRRFHADVDDFDCLICAEPASLKGKQFRNAAKCAHPLCNDCVAHYIRFKLLDDHQPFIRCPAFDCRHYLDPLACTSIVGENLFVEWCDALCSAAIMQFEKCHCPYPDCNAVVVNECGVANLKKTSCPSCKRLFCFKCSKVWHSGTSCEANDDLAFKKLVRRMDWKRCPSCRYFVEKRGGCRVMDCRCGKSFCYNCGKRLTGSRRCGCKPLSCTRFFHRMGRFLVRFCTPPCFLGR